MSADALDTPEFQRALAALLVRPALLADYLAAPAALAREFALSDAQHAALAHAGGPALAEFAHDLLDKRVGLLARFAPALIELLRRRGALGEVVHGFVRAYPSMSLAEQPHRVMRDFFWFHDHVQAWAGRPPRDLLLDDILRFERLQAELLADEAAAQDARALEAALRARPLVGGAALDDLVPRLGAHVRLAVFSCQVQDAIRALTTGVPLDDAALGPPLRLLMTREPRRRLVRHVQINDRTHALLDLCDGARSTRAIAAALAGGPPPAAVLDGCRDLLLRMASLSMVVLAPAAPRGEP